MRSTRTRSSKVNAWELNDIPAEEHYLKDYVGPLAVKKAAARVFDNV